MAGTFDLGHVTVHIRLLFNCCIFFCVTGCHILLIHSSNGLLLPQATMRDTGVNIHIQVCVWMFPFLLSSYLGVGFLGGNFNIFRNCYTVCHGSCILYTPPEGSGKLYSLVLFIML